ncbi:MAG: hypothetical protein QOI80_3196 [Solirubrobacteraceae bacterium]|nr:hypothetical protein [Solirubrobacteraceae bacterium]
MVTAAPRVSVIMPARDAAATLPETLASVRGQTVSDWEVVLVDDGSGDDTAAIARAADERVRVVRNATSVGPSRARNRALREARGELVAVLDADDLWKPTYLESQIGAYERALAEGRRVGAVCCDAELAGPAGSVGLWSDRVGRVEHIDLDALLQENLVWVGVLGAREAFLDIGGWYEHPTGDAVHEDCEDYDLALRLVEAGWEIVVNPEVLAVYRLGAGARSAQIVRTARANELLLARALGRDALTPAQQRIARRRTRLFEIVRRRAGIAAEPRPLRRAAATLALAPRGVMSVLENPQRWRHWVRHGPRSAGAERHVSS